ncbi:hypothetical protein [Flavivirga jejuensis]|uniref:DUF4347 domain-containing protein n=1 Tax=Flavivirga jejuensis TaxID=870487 RepID=A0ABT8WTA6_9FLAO|nr:hypothetical protein [Flavivirga jejuensis]MDO5976415.1 hypothetical protein [Flavivirga jejuensis]
MKANIYILLILLLSFSFGNAQSTTEITKKAPNKVILVSVNNETVTATTNNLVETVKENDVLLIDATELKESIARSTSDIRLYFNRIRNVENIKLLFPKMNKIIKV